MVSPAAPPKAPKSTPSSPVQTDAQTQTAESNLDESETFGNVKTAAKQTQEIQKVHLVRRMIPSATVPTTYHKIRPQPPQNQAKHYTSATVGARAVPVSLALLFEKSFSLGAASFSFSSA